MPFGFKSPLFKKSDIVPLLTVPPNPTATLTTLFSQNGHPNSMRSRHTHRGPASQPVPTIGQIHSSYHHNSHNLCHLKIKHNNHHMHKTRLRTMSAIPDVCGTPAHAPQNVIQQLVEALQALGGQGWAPDKKMIPSIFNGS